MIFLNFNSMKHTVILPIWAKARGDNSQSEHANTPSRRASREPSIPKTHVRSPQGTFRSKIREVDQTVLFVMSPQYLTTYRVLAATRDSWDTPVPRLTMKKPATSRSLRCYSSETIWILNLTRIPKAIYGSSWIHFDQQESSYRQQQHSNLSLMLLWGSALWVLYCLGSSESNPSHYLTATCTAVQT